MKKISQSLLLISALVSTNIFTANANVLPFFTIEECQRGTTVLVNGEKVNFYDRNAAIQQLAKVPQNTEVTLHIPVRSQKQYKFCVRTFTVGQNLVQTITSIADKTRSDIIRNPMMEVGDVVLIEE